MKASLILEDGTVFKGTALGAAGSCVSEIVFNTSMTGYQEVLTDPSYAGQAIVMTYPMIGNYGLSDTFTQSGRPWADGFIVREISRNTVTSPYADDISEYLRKYDIPVITGIDTRALTRLIRDRGTMNGMLTTDDVSPDEVMEAIRAYRVEGAVDRVSTRTIYRLSGGHRKVALYDFGAKRNIAESLARRGCDVTVFPARTAAAEVLAGGFDGIMLSNGPGDPKDVPEIIREMKTIYDSGIPVFAICLGHQLMALATGADTYKRKYGHRGGNHPVRELGGSGRVFVTSQNHGYAVDAGSIDPEMAVPAFENVNDGTNEGLIYKKRPVMTVQFHPEASPGPQDAGFLFDRFIEMIDRGGDARA